jgi:acetyl esterase/lipase
VLRFLPHDVADMHRNYLGGPETGADGYAMPGLAELDGLGPTLVVNAEYDDLRASGEAFVASAARAGVDVQQVTAPGMLRGFLFAPTSIEPVARLYDLLAATVRGCASDHPG